MAESLLVRTGRLLDVESGELLPDRRLLVDAAGRVEVVLTPSQPGPPAGSTRELDLSGLTVLAGLIDCHAHLIGDIEFAGVPAIGQTAEEELAAGERNAAATLRAGFTSVRDVGTYRAHLDVRLRERIDAGRALGPRMQCAGGYVTKPGGGGEVTGLAGSAIPAEMRRGVVRTPDEVGAAVRFFLDGGADLIKTIATGAVLTRGTHVSEIELDQAMLEAAVGEAGRRGAHVAAHAHGSEGIKVAIRAGVRSVEHGSLLDDEGIELLVHHGTWLVADVYNGDWIDEVGRRDGWPAETLAKNAATTLAQRDAVAKAIRAGVRLAYGTDSGVYPHGRNAIQFGYLVRLGMTPIAAIRSATLEAAELMGWSDRVGSLEHGRFADLIAVDGDPTIDAELLRRPLVVAKSGVVVRDERGRSPASQAAIAGG